MQFERKLKLRSFNELKPSMLEPPAPLPFETFAPYPTPPRPAEAPPPPPKMEKPQALWVEMPLSKQYLRIVLDQRVNMGRRIFRIELYDKDRTERQAVFRRSTEAIRR